MKILILNGDYEGFLRQLYATNPSLKTASYASQMETRNESLFGTADFYSHNLRALGHQSAEIHLNNLWLQSAWAREHGMAVPADLGDTPSDRTEFVERVKRLLRPYKRFLMPLAHAAGLSNTLGVFESKVLLAQIEEFDPDVILNQDMLIVGSDLLRRMRKPHRLIVGQIGVDPPQHLDASVYDLVLSQLPWVCEHFRAQGVPAEDFHLAFEPSIITKLGPAPEKDTEVCFVGSLSASHRERVLLLEAVARRFPLKLWVPSLSGIPASSPLWACRQGVAYGAHMYRVLQRANIVLNSHIDVAKGTAANMRLFEATGVGAFLLTEGFGNLPTLFAPGKEVGAYTSVEDCLSKISYYLDNPAEREAIAQAGQAHTLREHRYRDRAEQLIRYLGEISPEGRVVQ